MRAVCKCLGLQSVRSLGGGGGEDAQPPRGTAPHPRAGGGATTNFLSEKVDGLESGAGCWDRKGF